MKKITAIMVVCVLAMTIALPVWAADNGLSMTDVQAAPGETIQIKVSLTEQLQGNALGITYTYDENQLEAIPDQCGWSRKGTLQDFGSNRDGVWAVNDPVDLKGEVCVLTFRVLENAEFADTEVSCTLVVKNGARDVGTWQASAMVTRPRAHSYGDWTDSGEVGHSRSCRLCGARQTQSHSWEEGSVTQDPENQFQGIRTDTCSICGGTRTQRAGEYVPERLPTEPTRDQWEAEPTKPTQPRPEPTYPTEVEEVPPVTTAPRPTEDPKDESVKPTQSPDRQEESGGYVPGDYNRPPEETGAASGENDHSGHDHAHDDAARETIPVAIPIEGWTGDPEETAMEAHDHDHEQVLPENKNGGAVFLITCAVLAAAGVLVYKKTKGK